MQPTLGRHVESRLDGERLILALDDGKRLSPIEDDGSHAAADAHVPSHGVREAERLGRPEPAVLALEDDVGAGRQDERLKRVHAVLPTEGVGDGVQGRLRGGGRDEQEQERGPHSAGSYRTKPSGSRTTSRPEAALDRPDTAGHRQARALASHLDLDGHVEGDVLEAVGQHPSDGGGAAGALDSETWDEGLAEVDLEDVGQVAAGGAGQLADHVLRRDEPGLAPVGRLLVLHRRVQDGAERGEEPFVVVDQAAHRVQDPAALGIDVAVGAAVGKAYICCVVRVSRGAMAISLRCPRRVFLRYAR